MSNYEQTKTTNTEEIMSEIEQLYENTGLIYCDKCKHDSDIDCLYLCENKYPPFTAEKQLKLIKWIAHKAHNGLLINKHITDGGASMVFDNLGCESTLASNFISFEECLAKLANSLWQDLTEEERKQVKEMLE